MNDLFNYSTQYISLIADTLMQSPYIYIVGFALVLEIVFIFKRFI